MRSELERRFTGSAGLVSTSTKPLVSTSTKAALPKPAGAKAVHGKKGHGAAFHARLESVEKKRHEMMQRRIAQQATKPVCYLLN